MSSTRRPTITPYIRSIVPLFIFRNVWCGGCRPGRELLPTRTFSVCTLRASLFSHLRYRPPSSTQSFSIPQLDLSQYVTCRAPQSHHLRFSLQITSSFIHSSIWTLFSELLVTPLRSKLTFFSVPWIRRFSSFKFSIKQQNIEFYFLNTLFFSIAQKLSW